MRRWFRLLGQRATWREAHRIYNNAARYMDDVTPEFRMLWIESSLRAERLIRACKTLASHRARL